MRVVTTGTGRNGVCLLGEAWGKAEAVRGLPFQGPSGARLAKMLGMLGLDRKDFLVTNVCSFQPPQNREPSPSEIAAWWPLTSQVIRDSGTRVVVPLGSVPLRAAVNCEGIQGKRGYVYWSDCLQMWTVPTVHPAFILRGNANWTAVWLRDVQQAVEIASSGPPAAPRRELVLNPNPEGAWNWIEAWKAANSPAYSFDIETPDKGDDEEEAKLAAGQIAGTIYRIGFAYRSANTTYALSIPWGAGYLSVVHHMFASSDLSVVWNRHFDVPRLRAAGVTCTPVIHDAQEMWHVLYPDLKKSLEFVAPILVPGQSYWKDQAHERPAFYNATDAAVTIEAYERLWGT